MRTVRNHRNLTQEGFAKAVGLDRKTINRIEQRPAQTSSGSNTRPDPGRRRPRVRAGTPSATAARAAAAGGRSGAAAARRWFGGP
ncbi:helix-turn-helix domain-containing protein [Streptomyces sp. NBC_01591]|nr:helix-turn-helix domain-containing protein [Streptomyces sp. NBC_01591]